MPGRPAKPLDDNLRAFAAAYLRHQNATRAVRESYPEGSTERRSPATLVLKRARKYGLLPTDPGKHPIDKALLGDARMAEALAANVVPEPPEYIKELLEIDKRTKITGPPPPGPGIQRASFMQMHKTEMLARLSHMGRSSIAPFIGYEFVPDSENEQATELEAEEHEGVRGRWIYGLTMASIGKAIRAGYGPWIRELKYDPQGRPCIKIQNAPDIIALLAKITGVEKAQDQKMTVEVLMKASNLSPEEQRARALAAISKPKLPAGSEEVEDAILVEPEDKS